MSTTDLSKPLFIGAVGLSAFAAGGIASLSFISIPAISTAYYHPDTVSSTKTPLSDPSAILLSQWTRLFTLGSRIVPAIALLSAACNIGNAYIHYAPTATAIGNAIGGPWGTRRAYMFVAAAVSTVGIAPYTLIFMGGVNRELLARDQEGKGAVVESGKRKRKEGSTKSLLEWWGVLNGVRAVLPVIGTLLAFEAL